MTQIVNNVSVTDTDVNPAAAVFKRWSVVDSLAIWQHQIDSNFPALTNVLTLSTRPPSGKARTFKSRLRLQLVVPQLVTSTPNVFVPGSYNPKSSDGTLNGALLRTSTADVTFSSADISTSVERAALIRALILALQDLQVKDAITSGSPLY